MQWTHLNSNKTDKPVEELMTSSDNQRFRSKWTIIWFKRAANGSVNSMANHHMEIITGDHHGDGDVI